MMTDLLLTLAVTAAAVIAAWLGLKLGKLPGKAWLAAVLAPLAVLALTSIALNFRQLAFVPPTSWLTGGSARWISLTLTAAMTLGALAARVTVDGQRRALLALAGVVILRAGTLPFLGPLLSHAELEKMQTHIDGRGVCLQSTSLDHYVAVLSFDGDKVMIGDPLSGEETVPIAEFERDWRHVAIFLNRRPR